MKRAHLKKSAIICLCLLFLLGAVKIAFAVNSMTPPDLSGSQIISNYVDAVLLKAEAITIGTEVLLIQDLDPWWTTSNEDLLASNSMPYKKINSASIDVENFNNYKKIIIAGDQITSFYETYMVHKTKFDNYVANGGMLEWHACGYGWNGGDSSQVVLPGGVGIGSNYWYDTYNYLEIPSHSILAGVSNPFWGNFASHGSFINTAFVSGINIITIDSFQGPTLVEYQYGKGCVLASTQPLEFGLFYSEASGTILSNMIPYYCFPKDFISKANLTINKDPITGGTVYGYTQADSKNLIDCGKDCTEKFDTGTKVTLTAIPKWKSLFSYWDDGTCPHSLCQS